MRLSDLEPTQMQRVLTLLDEALDLGPDERTTWLARLSKHQTEFRELLAELLDDLPCPDTLVALPGQLAHALPEAPSLAGLRIGPYRIVRELGHGGMGSVWLAERDDGLFARRVALKLPHRSVGGGALLERFARERNILAGLAHPSIAQLLDAGITKEGQPYLALEYVDGKSLTEHCDAMRLTVRERIALLLQVLAAVQHAHQALVVHRDLKPNNVLVARDGTVRLLDFGIAKLISDGAAAETELTVLGGRVLTPEYASPEQVAGRPVGTATDVYSLGVVLYTLLCDQRPYAIQRSSRAALEEAILSAAPIRPSQQPLDGAIAAARGTSPKRLARALAGDLDTIVLKALKKDPAERYATADALRRDLERHLAGEPVEARPDTLAYRASKLIQRHWLALSAGLLVATLLLTAALVSFRQAELAREQARIAERETARARAVKTFLLGVFRSNTDQQADPLRAREATARDLLDEGARRIGDSLRSSPETQAEILDTLADMYHQLGLHADAARLRRAEVDALKRAHGPIHGAVAQALIRLGQDLEDLNDREAFVATMHEAEAILDRLGDTYSDLRGALWLNYAAFAKASSVGAFLHYAELAEQHARRHPSTYFWENLLMSLQLSARAHHFAGDYEGAVAGFYATLRELEQRGQTNSAWSVTPLVWLAESQEQLLQIDEAERSLRDALSFSRRFNGDAHPATLQTQCKLGGLLHRTGRRAEGSELIERTRAELAAPGANASDDALRALARVRGRALLEEGSLDEASSTLEASIAELRAHRPGSIPLAQLLPLMAAVQTARGRYAASAAALDEGSQLWAADGGRAVDPATFDVYQLERGRLALARGDAAAAEQAVSAIAIGQGGRHTPLDRLAAQLVLARARALDSRWDDALALGGAAEATLAGWPHPEYFPRLREEARALTREAETHARASARLQP